MMLMDSVVDASLDRLDLAPALLPDVAKIHSEASLRRCHQLTETVARSEHRILADDRDRTAVVPLIATRRGLDLIECLLHGRAVDLRHGSPFDVTAATAVFCILGNVNRLGFRAVFMCVTSPVGMPSV